MVTLLRKVKLCCKELEADKSATMQLVVSSINNLTGHLEDVMEKTDDAYTAEFASALLNSVRNRFPKEGCMIKLNCMGHYLNPIHKGVVLRVFDMYMETREEIKELSSKYDTVIPSVATVRLLINDDTDEESLGLSPIEQLLMKRRASADVTMEAHESISLVELEMKQYESLVTDEARDSNAVNFWVDNKFKFPKLFLCA